MTTSETKRLAPALRALLESLIDYAGIYPPAALPLDTALANYKAYRDGGHAWMLRRLVLGGADMAAVPEALEGSVALLAETDDQRAGSLETKNVVAAARPVYCEVAITDLQKLVEVKKSNCFAKIRTGGVKPEAIPSTTEVAAFISTCADLRLPFKATAGLHHPIRAEYALTYETDAPRAVMHGFLNVLMASALAWHGERHIEPVLAETDATAFRFDDQARWRQKSLNEVQIRDARLNFMHSIGSCSFEEPVNELRALLLL